MTLAVGPIAILFTRQLYSVIQSHQAWETTVILPLSLIEKLRFWFNNLQSFNGSASGRKLIWRFGGLEVFLFKLMQSLFKQCGPQVIRHLEVQPLESYNNNNNFILYPPIYIIVYRLQHNIINTEELTIILLIEFIRRGHWLSVITTKLN